MTRQSLIAKIHIAKAQLGLDEDTYRALLRRHGADSAGRMDLTQLDGVLRELVAKGWKPSAPRKAGQRKQATGPEIEKIRAVWLFLHELGEVRNPSEAALAAYARRMVGIDDLHWADGPRRYQLIETLKKWAVRVLPGKMAPYLPAGMTVPALLDRVAPRRRVDHSYNALHDAWQWLVEHHDLQHGDRGADRSGANEVAGGTGGDAGRDESGAAR